MVADQGGGGAKKGLHGLAEGLFSLTPDCVVPYGVLSSTWCCCELFAPGTLATKKRAKVLLLFSRERHSAIYSGQAQAHFIPRCQAFIPSK